jgi:hypothetical protein
VGETSKPDKIYENFNHLILEAINNFINKYQIDSEYRVAPGSAIATLSSFLEAVQYKIDKKIYLLIDEYDHFANEILSFTTIDRFENTVSRQGFLRKFFEVIKKKTGSIIDRIFVTGVSLITLDSMTSGFNIAKNKTMDSNLNTMMGFTEAEASDLIDSNISSDYSKLQNLFSLKDKSQNYAILEDILVGVEAGYLDLALLRRNKAKSNYDALIELKYIKAADYKAKGETLVEQKLKEASEQLERYGKAAEFKDRKDLKKWTVVFAGTEATVKEIK